MRPLLALLRSNNGDRLLLLALVTLAVVTLVSLVLARRRRLWRPVAALGGAALLLGLWARFIEPRWIEVSHTRVPWPGPPLRLLVMGDLHVPRVEQDLLRRAVALANQERPDLVLLNGDYVTGYDAAPHKLAILDELRGLRARLGVFAVLGNHDSEPYESTNPRAAILTQHLQGLGVRVLNNASAEVIRGVTLIGLEDFLARRSDARAAFAAVPAQGARIVFAHNWRSLRTRGMQRFDVALTGHTHGGQVCVPLIGYCPLARGYLPYFKGLYRWPGGGALYVDRGLGESGIKARLACRPEVAVIDLAGDAAGAARE